MQNGYTPVLWAAEKGHATAVEALVEAGVNVHAARRDGATALALAVQSMDAKDDADEKKLDSIKRIVETLRPGLVPTNAAEEQGSKAQVLALIADATASRVAMRRPRSFEEFVKAMTPVATRSMPGSSADMAQKTSFVKKNQGK